MPDLGKMLDSMSLRVEREACIADFDAVAAKFNGTSELDLFAQEVLRQARAAIRKGQAKRAGACGLRLEECGGSCCLPHSHGVTEPCRCGGDNGDGCPA